MYITQQVNNLAMTATQLYIYLPKEGECWCHTSRHQISVTETRACMSTHKDRHNTDVVAVMQTPSPPLQKACESAMHGCKVAMNRFADHLHKPLHFTSHSLCTVMITTPCVNTEAIHSHCAEHE